MSKWNIRGLSRKTCSNWRSLVWNNTENNFRIISWLFKNNWCGVKLWFCKNKLSTLGKEIKKIFDGKNLLVLRIKSKIFDIQGQIIHYFFRICWQYFSILWSKKKKFLCHQRLFQNQQKIWIKNMRIYLSELTTISLTWFLIMVVTDLKNKILAPLNSSHLIKLWPFMLWHFVGKNFYV